MKPRGARLPRAGFHNVSLRGKSGERCSAPQRKAPFRVEPLGRMAVFLLPSLKLKQKKLGKSYEDIVHHFLMKHFAGYTASAGNIFGFWRDDETGREYYGEHKQYKVSFRGEDRVAMMQKFLSQLAGELNEDCIYLEYGEDAWLVYAK
jgi:hypothetical protein